MKRANLFIGLFLAVQVILPLRYYLSSDRYDERFAWRMFSPIRMVKCQLELRTGAAGTPIPLVRTFHEGWVTMAQRGRRPVLAAMVDHLCRKPDGPPVKLRLECQQVDGVVNTVANGAWDLCALGGL